MALKWTRSHSLRVELPPNANVTDIKQGLRGVKGITGSDSTPTVLTMGFAHRFTPRQLKRGPYRQARKVLVEHGVITPNMRARHAA